jgi:hypothetical protein
LNVERNSDKTLKASGAGAIATKANEDAVVHLAGAETVSGTKTFNASPVVPAPASDHVITKSCVEGRGTPGARSGVKGGNRLAGDRGVTAYAPTVAALRLQRW